MSPGQSTVEAMLLVSFLVVAMVAAAYAILPDLQGGVEALGDDAAVLLGSGTQDGSNDRR